MIEVFKTNVQEVEESKRIIQRLLAHFPESSLNFDLDDGDKILRAEGTEICSKKIMDLVASYGFHCEVLA